MENKEKNNIYYRLLMISAIIIPVIIGFSYAYFLAVVKVTNDKPTTITGTIVSDIDFELVDENNSYIKATNLIPLTSDQVSIYAETGNFSVRAGNNNNNVLYTISLTDVNIPDELKNEYFKWKLVCTSCNSNSSKNIEGSFINATNELILNTELLIEPNTIDDYKIMIWLEESDIDQNNTMNKSFSAKVKVNGELTKMKLHKEYRQKYRQLEWIASTGTQYIDTGVSPSMYDGNYTLELEELHSAITKNLYLFGAGTGSEPENSRALFRITGSSGGKSCAFYTNASSGSSNSVSCSGLIINSVNYIKVIANTANHVRKVQINEATKSSSATFVSISNKTFTIFGARTSTKFSGRLYYLKIYGKDNLVRNFIPAQRISDNKVGLYDIIENKFYSNVATGKDFTPGPTI